LMLTDFRLNQLGGIAVDIKPGRRLPRAKAQFQEIKDGLKPEQQAEPRPLKDRAGEIVKPDAALLAMVTEEFALGRLTGVNLALILIALETADTFGPAERMSDAPAFIIGQVGNNGL